MIYIILLMAYFIILGIALGKLHKKLLPESRLNGIPRKSCKCGCKRVSHHIDTENDF